MLEMNVAVTGYWLPVARPLMRNARR